MWGHPAELPPFVQQINKVDGVFSRLQNQEIVPNTMTKWAVDTQFPTYPIWRPYLANGDLVIDRNGTYNFSAFVTFSSLLEGRKSLYITRNGAIVGSGEVSGNSDVCSINSTIRCNAGDVISILIKQNTSHNMILLGANVSHSNLTVVRVYN